MNSAIIFSALFLGLAGSLHCMGMCGPLALALPVGNLKSGLKSIARAFFVGGRILVYSLMGALVAAMGQGISWLGFQKYWLIGMAFLLFLLVAGWEIDFMKKWRNQIRTLAREQTNNFPLAGFWLLGMGNGLLPCGLVYGALANAALSDQWQNGMLLMAIFGLANSWWHLVLISGISLPFRGLAIFKALASPRGSLALVTIALIWRLWHVPSENQLYREGLSGKSEMICNQK